MAVVLALGTALRTLAVLASGPVSRFENDSTDYLARARDLLPDGYHPLGYPLALRLTGGLGHPLLITLGQHALGLGTGGLVLGVALRAGLPPWGAALAAAPQLLDAWVVVGEQFVLAETLTAALVVAAVAAALRDRWVLAGLLTAAATLTRTVALGVAAVLVVALLAARPGRRRVLSATAALVVPLALYAGLFAARHGHPALTERTGVFLYGRMAPIASCVSLAADERPLCDLRPPAARPQGTFYLWHPDAPLKAVPGDVDSRAALAGRTGRAMLAGSPGAWARATLTDLAHYAWRAHTPGSHDQGTAAWLVDVRTSTLVPPADPRLADGHRETDHVSPGPTAVLRALQSHAGTPGWLLAVLLVLGAATARRAGPSPARRTAAVAGAAGLALLVVPSATVGWDVRFALPALPLLGLAAASAAASAAAAVAAVPAGVRAGDRTAW